MSPANKVMSNRALDAPPLTLKRLAVELADLNEMLPLTRRRLEALRRLDIRTVSDLLRHLPMRYEREAAQTTIRDLAFDVIGSAQGVLLNTRVFPRVGRKMGRFQATLQDATGTLALTWFNMPYLKDQLHPGMKVWVQGKVVRYHDQPQIVNAKWALVEEEETGDRKPEPGNAGEAEERLRPIYPATEGLSSAVIESIVQRVLPAALPLVSDPLPQTLRAHHHMPVLADAYRQAHQPLHEEESAGARRRLAFNELLLLQMGIALKRHYNQTQVSAPALRWSAAVDEHIRQRFPFPLTGAQTRVVREIAGDLHRPRPMNRLLQGDVGSGKTVVALYAMLMAVADRKQAALMAPTELLAEQHFASIAAMLEGSSVRMELLTASRFAPRSPERGELLQRISAGAVDLVIGTQALLTDSVRFADLAVVVIDEQHRFGVMQRAAFREQRHGSSYAPHHLVMTATPIPRTLSLTVFGDLDVSVIDELPPGRGPIVTRVVEEAKADEVYRYLAERLARGEQAYVVVPTIDAAGCESSAQLKSVREHAKLLQDKFLSAFRVAAVHGQLKRETRTQIMNRFREGKLHALVATTVIEVGVDVPNASVMVVEHAERFGLAQLHQLRGRVGRRKDGRKSLCVFIAEPTTDDAAARLKAIAETTDGFRIAEADFDIRGMGDLFGTRQSGAAPLRVARIPQDLDLLQLAKKDASAIVAADPKLENDQHHDLRRVLLQQYGDTLGLVDVG
jgi:ATP-dependent DNA helicase RecG